LLDPILFANEINHKGVWLATDNGHLGSCRAILIVERGHDGGHNSASSRQFITSYVVEGIVIGGEETTWFLEVSSVLQVSSGHAELMIIEIGV